MRDFSLCSMPREILNFMPSFPFLSLSLLTAGTADTEESEF